MQFRRAKGAPVRPARQEDPFVDPFAEAARPAVDAASELVNTAKGTVDTTKGAVDTAKGAVDAANDLLPDELPNGPDLPDDPDYANLSDGPDYTNLPDGPNQPDSSNTPELPEDPENPLTGMPDHGSNPFSELPTEESGFSSPATEFGKGTQGSMQRGHGVAANENGNYGQAQPTKYPAPPPVPQYPAPPPRYPQPSPSYQNTGSSYNNGGSQPIKPVSSKEISWKDFCDCHLYIIALTQHVHDISLSLSRLEVVVEEANGTARSSRAKCC